jgi:non-canonical purine NTP pyrophosphatase (RdgB/HAM1 family)
MESITFITGNAAKAQFLVDYLKRPIEHMKLDLPEIQSLDLEEIVTDKVKRAFEIIQKPVLVEDGSLELVGLKNLPGPLAKWFYETLGNEGICKLVDGLDSREAVTKCIFALYDGKEIKFFHGEMRGSIAERPRGETGFGFDPSFIVDGFDKTRGEMDKETWAETSMRTKALAKMHEYFENNKN